MKGHKYNMSFTVGGLLHRESALLAKMFIDIGDWDLVGVKVLKENSLQSRTINTLKRTCREVISRLKTLSKIEIQYFDDCSNQEQAYILWIAVCRRYRFVAEFAIEVLRERHITLKSDLVYEDFDYFFNKKSEWHLELDEITLKTRSKLRQILFKILREADLLTANNMIHAAMLSPRLLDLIHQDNPRDVLYFPVFESDVKRVKR